MKDNAIKNNIVTIIALIIVGFLLFFLTVIVKYPIANSENTVYFIAALTVVSALGGTIIGGIVSHKSSIIMFDRKWKKQQDIKKIQQIYDPILNAVESRMKTWGDYRYVGKTINGLGKIVRDNRFSKIENGYWGIIFKKDNEKLYDLVKNFFDNERAIDDNLIKANQRVEEITRKILKKKIKRGLENNLKEESIERINNELLIGSSQTNILLRSISSNKRKDVTMLHPVLKRTLRNIMITQNLKKYYENFNFRSDNPYAIIFEMMKTDTDIQSAIKENTANLRLMKTVEESLKEHIVKLID